jgi:hypothetical protein
MNISFATPRRGGEPHLGMLLGDDWAGCAGRSPQVAGTFATPLSSDEDPAVSGRRRGYGKTSDALRIGVAIEIGRTATDPDGDR